MTQEAKIATTNHIAKTTKTTTTTEYYNLCFLKQVRWTNCLSTYHVYILSTVCSYETIFGDEFRFFFLSSSRDSNLIEFMVVDFFKISFSLSLAQLRLYKRKILFCFVSPPFIDVSHYNWNSAVIPVLLECLHIYVVYWRACVVHRVTSEWK